MIFSTQKVDRLTQRLETLNKAMGKYIELGAVSKGLDKTQNDISDIQSQIQQELKHNCKVRTRKTNRKIIN